MVIGKRGNILMGFSVLPAAVRKLVWLGTNLSIRVCS